MPLIVETGTGLANADSYCSLAFANAYLAALGFTAWDSLDDSDDKEPALRRATQYMLTEYRSAWRGNRNSSTQALDWPRYGVPQEDGLGGYYANNVVPTEIQQACALLAVRANAGELDPDLGPPVTEETIGPITTKYAQGARQTTKYRQIDGLLRPFLGPMGYNFAISRA